ncbi:MAG: hypothetical protein WCE20_02985, partial [Rhizomicrobium sp.]
PYPYDYSYYPPDYVPPAPPPSGQAEPGQAQSWYFCSDPKGYYPYVQSCKSGWQPVPVVPPNAPANAPSNAPPG